jgi:hypothetical protein
MYQFVTTLSLRGSAQALFPAARALAMMEECGANPVSAGTQAESLRSGLFGRDAAI